MKVCISINSKTSLTSFVARAPKRIKSAGTTSRKAAKKATKNQELEEEANIANDQSESSDIEVEQERYEDQDAAQFLSSEVRHCTCNPQISTNYLSLQAAHVRLGETEVEVECMFYICHPFISK